MIRTKVQVNYPHMQQRLVGQLSSLIQKNKFYRDKDGQVVIRMTPLLRFLDASTTPSHHAIAEQIRKPRQSQKIDKGLAIGQVVLGPERIVFLDPTQVSGARVISKSVAVRRHPAQAQAKQIRQKVQIPIHIIALCGLDDLVSVCPKIPLKKYQEKVAPFFTGVHDDVYSFLPDNVADAKDLSASIFRPGDCACYIVYEDDGEWVLEAHVWCGAVVGGRNGNGIFSIRFFKDFVEYSAVFFNGSILRKVSNEEANDFLQYNLDEYDHFLGWDADTNTIGQNQDARKQATRQRRLPAHVVEDEENMSSRFVQLIRKAIRIQKAKRSVPVQGVDWEYNLSIVPSKFPTPSKQ
jgi:hypothetical protein